MHINPKDKAISTSYHTQAYERFFQGFSQKQADTHGIVYTPMEQPHDL